MNTHTTTNPIRNIFSITLLSIITFGYCSADNSDINNLLITEFAANANGNAIIVEWTTATELNSYYFNVQRSNDGVSWINVGKVDAAGYSTERINYLFTDTEPLSGNSYYRLQVIGTAGDELLSEIISVNNTGLITHQLIVYYDLSGKIYNDLENAPAGIYVQKNETGFKKLYHSTSYSAY